jgi:signal transduction histidine kinase
VHRRPSSLRRQLLWYLLIPVGTLSLISIGLAFYLGEKFLTIAYDENLFDTTETLARQIHVSGGRVSVDLPPVAWEMLRYDGYDKIFPSVKWADGELIAGDADLPDPPGGSNRIGKAIYHDGVYKGYAVRIASLYMPVSEAGKGREILIQTAETLVKRHKVTEEIIWGVVLPQLILVILAAISVWIGVKRGLGPLHVVSQAIGNRSHLDLRPVAETDVPQEAKPLLRSINDLMQRLNRVLHTQRRFIADAAHQLRTPIAGLKTQTEFAMRQTDLEAIQRVLPRIHTSVERSNRLINQLLKLARSEALLDQPQTFDPIDLNQLLREVTAEWVPAALEKDVDLGYENRNGSTVVVKGNNMLLREMLANVLDNAIRYSPERGKITVRLSNDPRPLISVEDTGPGIPAEERERVFERFYRLSGNAGEGSGLGLAIVREIADAHGARVSIAERADGNGARVNIAFSE